MYRAVPLDFSLFYKSPSISVSCHIGKLKWNTPYFLNVPASRDLPKGKLLSICKLSAVIRSGREAKGKKGYCTRCQPDAARAVGVVWMILYFHAETSERTRICLIQHFIIENVGVMWVACTSHNSAVVTLVGACWAKPAKAYWRIPACHPRNPLWKITAIGNAFLSHLFSVSLLEPTIAISSPADMKQFRFSLYSTLSILRFFKPQIPLTIFMYFKNVDCRISRL